MSTDHFQQPNEQQGLLQHTPQYQNVHPQQQQQQQGQYYQQGQPIQQQPQDFGHPRQVVWIQKSASPICLFFILIFGLIPFTAWLTILLGCVYVGQSKKGLALALGWWGLFVIHMISHAAGPLALILFVLRLVSDIIICFDLFAIASRLSSGIPIMPGECAVSLMSVVHTKVIELMVSPSFVGGDPNTPREWSERMSQLGLPTSV
jgi:hypothetical protein